jgi:hypothetical protein
MARTDVAKLVAKAQKYADSHGGEIPSRETLRKVLKVGAPKAQVILAELRGTAPVTPAAPAATPADKPRLTETDDVAGDKRTITLDKTRVQTVDELLTHCKVDTSVWEVERFIVNKWEMGYVRQLDKLQSKNKNTQEIETHENRQADFEELFQVKAFLRRKFAQNVDGYVVENTKLRASNARLRVELAQEKGYTRRLAQNHCGYDDFLAGLDKFMQKIGDQQLPVERVQVVEPQIVLPTPAVRNGHTEDAVMQWSDTHFGDRIRREDTSGFPEYDVTIAGNRWGYVISKAKQVLTLHRTMYPLKRLYIWFGGDIGNGSLHDSPNSNELFDFAQCHFSYHMFKFGLEDLLTLTVPDAQGNVVVEEIVLLFTVGNHMRVDEKMPHKYQAQRTGDWMIYQMIIDRFKDNPKVSIRQQMSPFIFENIRGHRHLFAHGMQVGYRNSPDAQNKSIGAFIQHARALFDSPEWRRKNGLMGETFSRACIGDIHVPITFPRFKSNGSLNGQNELGVNWTLEPIPAGQQIWGVADKHQETWQYFLECSHIQKEPGDFNKYGNYAKEYTAQWGR